MEVGRARIYCIQDPIASSLPQNGDPTGFRRWLEQRGTTFNVFYTDDVPSNFAGAIERGTTDQGRVEL